MEVMGKACAEIREVELLRQLLMFRRPGRAFPLLRDGLLSFLWAEPWWQSSPSRNRTSELVFSRVGVRKIRAAQYMVRRFAGQAIGEAPLASDPGPVVRFLFLNNAAPDRETQGLLFLDASGRAVGSWIFGQILAPAPMPLVRHALAVAQRLEAKSLVLFYLRPGGLLEVAGDELELVEWLRAPARILGIEIADVWVITGPTRWRFLGPASFPAGPPGGRHFVGGREIPFSEVRDRLAELLHSGPWAQGYGSPALEVPAVRELLKDPQSFRELAATPPDELHHPGLSLAGHRALAAALELTRRLGEVDVTARPLAGGPQELARESFPEVRHSPREQVWLVALNQHRRTIWREPVPPAVLEQDGAELKRLVLRVALKPAVFSLVPLCFHPEALPLALAEKLVTELREDLSTLGVRCDGPFALSADGRWAFRGQMGRLRS